MLIFPWNKPKNSIDLSVPFEVLNQGDSNKCESYAITSIGEDFYKKKLDPEIVWTNSLKISNGQQPSLEQVLQSVIEYGFDSNSALKAKSASPVWGFESNFNNVLGAIGRGYEVVFGLYWQQEWDGLYTINSNFQNLKLTPHALKAFGVEIINGQSFLKVLNSKGTTVGENGVQLIGNQIEILSPYIIKF